MSDDLADIRERFLSLRRWRKGGRRAPHKPLLVLLAIGRCLRGEERLAPFATVDKKLAELLCAFGLPNPTTPRPDYPFWRLQGDGIWEIDRPHLVRQTERGDALVGDLREHRIAGGFLASDHAALRADPSLAHELANEILHAHFPQTYHADLLQATGIGHFGAGASPHQDIRQVAEIADAEGKVHKTTLQRPRDAAFRQAVLKAYCERCAVCEFSVRLEGTVVAVEAAHIRWHNHAGPAVVRNGLALCSLHHRLFDRGAFGLDEGLVIRMSARTEGPGWRESLGRFDGARLPVVPTMNEERPAPEFLRWHRHQVLRP